MSRKQKASNTQHAHPHPSHEGELPRIRRARGQVEAVERMIAEGRYCIDVLQQVKAARAALQAVEAAILRTHLESCVREALTAGDAFEAEKKLKEITDLLGR